MPASKIRKKTNGTRGTKSVTGTAGLPAGRRTVQLEISHGQSVYCYFTVTSPGNNPQPQTTVTVFAMVRGAGVQGALVYLDGNPVGITGSGGSLMITGVSYGTHTIVYTYASKYSGSVTVTLTPSPLLTHYVTVYLQ